MKIKCYLNKNIISNVSLFLAGILPVIAFLSIMLPGCVSSHKHTGTVEVREALVKLERRSAVTFSNLPRKVYVFPPIVCDRQGRPLETLTYTELPDGEIFWNPPSENAALWQREIEESLRKKGFEIVSFQELVDGIGPYAIMTLNSYYFSRSVPGTGQDTSQFLYVRVTGSVLPADLDPVKRRDLVDQQAQAFFSKADDSQWVTGRVFRVCIDNMGGSTPIGQRMRIRDENPGHP